MYQVGYGLGTNLAERPTRSSQNSVKRKFKLRRIPLPCTLVNRGPSTRALGLMIYAHPVRFVVRSATVRQLSDPSTVVDSFRIHRLLFQYIEEGLWLAELNYKEL